MSAGGELTWRSEPQAADRERVRRIVAGTGFFNAEEVDVAVELVDDRLAKGAASDYYFLFADLGGETVGYSCFGRIPLTRSSFDLYWIAVASDRQRGGVGRRLLAATEEEVRRLGGARIYVETSTRPQYAATRGFYAGCGYDLAAELPDFYAPGDGKAIYCKAIDWRVVAAPSD